MGSENKEVGNRAFKKTITVLLLVLFTLHLIAPCLVVSQEDNIVLRVGIYENPPKIFTDEDGIATGIFPVLMEHIAEREGWEIEYVHGSFSQGLERLRNGEIEVMQDVAWSKDREEIYAFNQETVFPDWGRLYSRPGVDVQTFLDLEGKRIAVMEEGIYNIGPEGIRAMTADFGINATFFEYPSYRDVFEALDAGDADVGAVNRFFGQRFENEYGVDRTPILFTPISIRFAFDRNDPESEDRIARIDHHLIEMKADSDSIYYRAIDEFIGERGEREAVEIFPGWAKYLMFIVVGGIVFLFGTNLVLKKKVDLRTAELRDDIRKRKSVEKDLREHRENLEDTVEKRTKELQGSLEELKTFTYSVSHDLRAPVRAMKGFSGILLEESGDKLDDTGKEYLERINAATHNMDKLMSDLLRYGRLTHEKMEVKRVPLRRSVDDVISEFSDEIESMGAKVKTNGKFPDVIANEMILKQCISNLLENALKFVEDEKVPEVEIRSIMMNGDVRLEVGDNGIGIAKEYHDKIFEVFERLHGREVYSGTGVGLAVVRKGIERMGGKVGVDSEPGKGSMFWIRLPMAEVGR